MNILAILFVKNMCLRQKGGHLNSLSIPFASMAAALIRKSKIKQLTYRNLRYQEESINETILCNRQPRAFAF